MGLDDAARDLLARPRGHSRHRHRSPHSPLRGDAHSTRRAGATSTEDRTSASRAVRDTTGGDELRRITIFDTTLRDGEQSPGIALVPDAKAEIGLALDRLGVDVIEAGFAASSRGEAEGVRAVAESVPRATVACMARASEHDVHAAAEALAPARRSRIHVVLGTSPIHMERKLRLEP